MIHAGVISVAFRQLPVPEIVGLAVQAKLSAIEWGGDVHVPPGQFVHARLTHELTVGAGLRVAGYASYYRAGSSEEQGLPFGEVLATAVALGAPCVRVWAGNVPSAQASAELRGCIAADLQRVAGLAATAGVGVATEFHADTLTDTAESAARLLRDEAAHPNLSTHWQPRLGEDPAAAEAGLRTVLPWLRNLHVFHWWPGAGRRSLAEGRDRWVRFLRVAADAGRDDRDALIEFVAGDDPDNFLRDAAALRCWLEDLTLGPATEQP